MPYFENKALQVTIKSQAIFLIGLLCLASLYTSWVDRIERKLYGVKPGVTIEEHQIGGFMPGEVEVVVDELVIKYRQMPRDAHIDRDSGEIIHDINGTEVNVEATTRAIFAAPSDTNIKVITMEIPARHNSDQLKPITKEIGSFYTWSYGSWQRHENIVLAARSINNQIIWPGGDFSFNKTVGPRTPERGYRPAPVIGGDGIGFGGGICQVSTTLYNAALAAELEIVEKHQHSTKVPYINAGKDATVVYGAQDLRLKNNFPYPVIIKSGVYRGKILVTIMGKQ